MQEKIYKASLFKQIIFVIGKTLSTLWAAYIIVGMIEIIVCEYVLHFKHLGINYYWNKYLMFFILIILIVLGYYMLYTFKLNKIQVNVSNKTMFIMKNGREEQHNLGQTIFKFEKQTTRELVWFKISSKYVMKTLSPNGSVKEYDLLAFSKRTLCELSENITETKERGE